MQGKNVLKIYSFFIAILPIMIIYGFKTLSVLTLADYVLLIIFFFEIGINKKLRINKNFILLILYLLIQPLWFLICPIEEQDWGDIAGTAWKLAFYIFFIGLFSGRLIKEIVVKAFRAVGVISSIYGVLQYFFGTFLNISLSPYLPLLPILRTEIKEQQDSWIAYNWTVRARSCFTEPSHFSLYLILALMIELFIVNREERKLSYCIFYIIGIFSSYSSTGIIGLLLLVLMSMIVYNKTIINSISKNLIICILVCLPILFFLLYKYGYIEYFLDHTFANGKGLASQTHFRDIGQIFSEDISLMNMVLGHGLQDVEGGYLPGWFRTYYCLGIIGILLYMYVFLKTYISANKGQKVIILVFVALNFGTEIMLGAFIILYMSIGMMKERYVLEGV